MVKRLLRSIWPPSGARQFGARSLSTRIVRLFTSSPSKNLQVRFRDDEFDELSAFAEQCGLPVSTAVRSLVLQAIAPVDDLKSALDKLETDLAAVRRKALSA
jgi:hypothetical protein